MIWFFIFIGCILLFAFLIDWRRKKNNNQSHHSPHASAKPGENMNYQMGDNRFTNGGGDIGGGGE
jgi:hypothetical protein